MGLSEDGDDKSSGRTLKSPADYLAMGKIDKAISVNREAS